MRPLTLPPDILDSGAVYWLLCTRGFEAEAEVLVSRYLCDAVRCRGTSIQTAKGSVDAGGDGAHTRDRPFCLWRVPRSAPPPSAALAPAAGGVACGGGEAAVGQLLLGLRSQALQLPPEVMQQLPGIIRAFAFVGAAVDVPLDKEAALPALASWAAGLGYGFKRALPLTAFGARMHAPGTDTVAAGVLPCKLPSFRASLVRDGAHTFRSTEAMVAVGGGCNEATGWAPDLARYDVEVFGVLFEDTLTLGLSCNLLGDARTGAVKSSKLPGEIRPWLVAGGDRKHLRPSTAAVMLELARVSAREALLDFCGGIGTIALEAATHTAGLRAVSSDLDAKVCELARSNVAAAVAQNSLAPEAAVEVRCTDVFGISSESLFDVVVAELPFRLQLQAPDMHGGAVQSIGTFVASRFRSSGTISASERQKCQRGRISARGSMAWRC